jgi:hypothetical protein
LQKKKFKLPPDLARHQHSIIAPVAIEQPAFGQVRVANELRKRGLTVSPAGVRCVWQCHEPRDHEQAAQSTGAKVAQEGLILTEAQVIALDVRRQII